MGKPTLPSPRPSFTAPAAPGDNRSDSSQSEVDSDTVIVQSTISVPEEEAIGNGIAKQENKQKRKRTSAADQATLEAEYKQNSKPNKAARAEIVKRVELTEKEVQIWFQNRRQINRRKSRPLLPHEIAAFGLGGMVALSSDPASVASSSHSAAEGVTRIEEARRVSSEDNARPSQELKALLAPINAEQRIQDMKTEAVEAVLGGSQASLTQSKETLSFQFSSQISNSESTSFLVSEGVARSFSSTPGYLANRWNAKRSSFSTPSTSQVSKCAIHLMSNAQGIDSSDNSGTNSSHVRLSMSLAGKAELVSTASSPTRAHLGRPTSSGSIIPQKRMRGLQRSQSALPFGPLPRKAAVKEPFVPHMPRGRSRDARTWEFCCDMEARDELTTQAENESNGSAVAAISLLRSTSNSTLKSNANKRNAVSIKQDSSTHGKRPKLGRASSSLARLETTEKGNAKSPYNQTSNGKDGLKRSPSGDSDKENRVPYENGGNPRRRPLPSARSEKFGQSRPVMGNVSTHAVKTGGKKNKKRKTYVEPNIFEDSENIKEAGAEEVEKFMLGEISPSKKGDLDCIQGLLSLSQGNWR